MQELRKTWNFEYKWPQIISLTVAEEVRYFLAEKIVSEEEKLLTHHSMGSK